MNTEWLDEKRAQSQINSEFTPVALTVGHEKTPVILIDDFLMNPQGLIQIAINHAVFYAERKTAYPGLRADLPESAVRAIASKAEKIIRESYGISSELSLNKYYGSYSVVATHEKDLGVIQRVPHYDTKHPLFFAVLLYLNSGNHGGTNFFRHSPTDFERISEENFSEYIQRVEQFFKNNGLPAAQYYRCQDEHYINIGSVDYKPNRLVIYPGNLLHSGEIKVPTDIDPNPETGRLTANIFLEFSNSDN